MTIFVSNPTDLATLLSTATGVPLATADLVFGTPRPTTATELANYGKNTAVIVSALPAASARVTGAAIIVYDRLPLAALSTYNLNNCSISDGVAQTVWLPEVIGYLGIPFATTDLVDHSSVIANGQVSVLLEATPTSLGWFGATTLNFSAYPDISTAFTTNILSGF